MHKHKKITKPHHKSTIGSNPLDQLELVPGKNRKKAKFKDESPQLEIKQILLQKQRPKGSSLSRWFKSVLGQFT
jgi:hypothetical protein